MSEEPEAPPAEAPAAEAPAAESPAAEAPAAEAPTAEAPAAEAPAADAPAAEAPAAAAPAETETGPPSPSKSNLVDLSKRASQLSKKESRVRMKEPGEDEERRPSDERRPSQPRRSGSVSVRTSLRESREMSRSYLRRSSERPSKAKFALGSIISFGKGGAYGESFAGGKIVRYMNSYKLDSDKPFHVETVEKILKEVLTEALDNLTYDPEKCPKQAKWACSAIRAKIKEQAFDRYKMVCVVTIGEKRYQDMCSVIRFLWDIDRDRYATFVHDNMYVYAYAMCFGIYYE